MTHVETRSKLSPYLEGELTLAQRARVDAHLDACEACRAMLHELRESVGLLRGLPEPEPPAGLADGVMERVRAGETARSPWRWLAVAAPTAAVVAIAAVGLWRPLGSPQAGETAVSVARAPAPPASATGEASEARLRGAHTAPEPSDPEAHAALQRAFRDTAGFVTAMEREPERLERVVEEAEHRGLAADVANHLRASEVRGADRIAVRFERVRIPVGGVGETVPESGAP